MGKRLIAVRFLRGSRNTESRLGRERALRACRRVRRQGEHLLKMLRLVVLFSGIEKTAWRWGVGRDVFYMRRLPCGWNPGKEFLSLQRTRLIGGDEILVSKWRQAGTRNSGESIASFDCYPMPFSEWQIWMAGLRSLRRGTAPRGGQL